MERGPSWESVLKKKFSAAVSRDRFFLHAQLFIQASHPLTVHNPWSGETLVIHLLGRERRLRKTCKLAYLKVGISVQIPTEEIRAKTSPTVCLPNTSQTITADLTCLVRLLGIISVAFISFLSWVASGVSNCTRVTMVPQVTIPRHK
jgi:hypothetical protein